MVTELKRLIRHCLTGSWVTRRFFPRTVLVELEEAIATSEARHDAELRLVIEHALPLTHVFSGTSSRERAIELFSSLRVWDTAGNSGVLLYLLLADRRIEIVADRGINQRVGSETWRAIAQQIEAHFRAGDFRRGVLEGLQQISALLETHFPKSANDTNELPDAPVVL